MAVGQRVLRRMWKRVPFCVLIEGEHGERDWFGKISLTQLKLEGKS